MDLKATVDFRFKVLAGPLNSPILGKDRDFLLAYETQRSGEQLGQLHPSSALRS